MSTPPVLSISNDLPIFKELKRRPQVKYMEYMNSYGHNCIDMNHSIVQMFLGEKLIHRRLLQYKFLEIHYYADTHTYIVKKQYYDVEFDGSMHPSERNINW